jgi:hypothetical protein
MRARSTCGGSPSATPRLLRTCGRASTTSCSQRSWHCCARRTSSRSAPQLEQRQDDLSTPTGWRANAELLRGAQFIFLDALHDGVQERSFLRGFEEVGLAAAPVLMLDDIRLWRMLSFWQDIERPKLDLTSFGHWSGTGLVDYA